jgi:hypothetical protein
MGKKRALSFLREAVWFKRWIASTEPTYALRVDQTDVEPKIKAV